MCVGEPGTSKLLASVKGKPQRHWEVASHHWPGGLGVVPWERWCVSGSCNLAVLCPSYDEHVPHSGLCLQNIAITDRSYLPGQGKLLGHSKTICLRDR